jgi:hypothetical protein
MSIGNTFVSALLRSPVHGLLSGSVDLVRYRGRRSGREITTPTQYAEDGNDVLILAGRPETKSWWRNFRDDHDVDVLVRGTWRSMIGRALLGARDPETVAPLLDIYLARFPKAARTLGDDPDARVAHAVVVRCRDRS